LIHPACAASNCPTSIFPIPIIACTPPAQLKPRKIVPLLAIAENRSWTIEKRPPPRATVSKMYPKNLKSILAIGRFYEKPRRLQFIPDVRPLRVFSLAIKIQ